jgi:hypothetical protein
MTFYKSLTLSAVTLASLNQFCPGAISVYLSGDGITTAEDSGISGVTTEDFNNATPTDFPSDFTSSVGTYSGEGGVRPDGQYGGDGDGAGGSGQYLGVASGETTTLTFQSDVSYFRLYFSAGNGGNTFDVLNDGNVVLSFNTAELLNRLPNEVGVEIEAINGDTYNTEDYYGKPGTGENNTEPYAYLHIVADGETFDQIQLSETGTAVFENDNHSIRETTPAIPGTLIDVSSTVPEPSSLGLLFSGSLLCLFARRRSHK